MIAPTKVCSLRLTHFRNYASTHINLNKTHVVLTGPNGAGKTNTLEAISLLSPGRGIKNASVTELPNLLHSKGLGWGIQATVESAGESLDICTGQTTIASSNHRKLTINDKAFRNHPHATHPLSLIWLTPQDGSIFLEGSEGRRQLIDRMIQGINPHHNQCLQDYEKAKRNRLQLLKENHQDPLWLNALEQTMAGTGVAIAANRLNLITQLNALRTTDPGPFPETKIDSICPIELALEQQPALDVEDSLKEIFAEKRDLDAKTGRTNKGPHRADYQVTHLQKGLSAPLCSTGEQKGLLIRIILTYCEHLILEHSKSPVLLIDEVAAHLDQARREALFERILDLNVQTWLTGVDPQLFTPLKGAADFISVQDGNFVEHC